MAVKQLKKLINKNPIRKAHITSQYWAVKTANKSDPQNEEQYSLQNMRTTLQQEDVKKDSELIKKNPNDHKQIYNFSAQLRGEYLTIVIVIYPEQIVSTD